jgi:hypothetical protein
MPARTYTVVGRRFNKVASTAGRPSVHVVEHGQVWKGDKSWEHRAVCGASITGVPVTRQRVTCRACRRFIERLARGED